MSEEPDLGDTRIVREYYANTPDGPMWLQDEVLADPADPPTGRHCQRCGHFNEPGAAECVSCGDDVTDAPVLGDD